MAVILKNKGSAINIYTFMEDKKFFSHSQLLYVINLYTYFVCEGRIRNVELLFLIRYISLAKFAHFLVGQTGFIKILKFKSFLKKTKKLLKVEYKPGKFFWHKNVVLNKILRKPDVQKVKYRVSFLEKACQVLVKTNELITFEKGFNFSSIKIELLIMYLNDRQMRQVNNLFVANEIFVG